jgi:uncharacterized hydrophobic protein (TIGR00271 family)
MNAAATVIAGLGLLENSPAVIIGAMLIAMLFGPVVGFGLGLAEGNMPLLGRSLLSELVGAASVLAIGYIVGLAGFNLPLGGEVLARSSPNLLDLLIALVGGIAGGFTFVFPGLTGVVVGVAIATALVPPLTSCGILLAHQLPGLAAGAFLLFLANFTAIAIGAMIVFWFAGHRPRAQGPAQSILLPRLLSLLLLAVLAAHFTFTFRRTITQSVLESGIRRAVSSEVAKIPGAYLVAVTLEPIKGATIARVVLRTPRPVPPQEVARLNDLVNHAVGTTVELHVRSVITAEATRQGYVYEPQYPQPEDQSSP